MTNQRFKTLASTLIAAAAIAVCAAKPAHAGIVLNATINGQAVAGLDGTSMLPGQDPATAPQTPGLFEISFFPGSGSYSAGNATVNFNGIALVQSYSPATGSIQNIFSALGDSTSVTIRNLGNIAASVMLKVTYDAFNFPASNPLLWTSTIATTRLDGGATFDATETIGDVTIDHTLLAAPGSQSISTVVSPSRPYTIVQTLDIFLPVGATANIQKSDTLAPIPEPSTYVMLGGGLLALAALRRRRRTAD